MRWRLAVQEFGFDVAYIKGELNNVADSMSRCVVGQASLSSEIHCYDSVRRTTLSAMLEEEQDGRVTYSDSHLFSLFREDRRHYFPKTETYSSFLNLLDGLACPMDDIPIQTWLFSNITDQQHPLLTHEMSPLDVRKEELLKQ